jgi:hypothetical protein
LKLLIFSFVNALQDKRRATAASAAKVAVGITILRAKWLLNSGLKFCRSS